MEDHNSCQRLGASYRHFSIPDCIYRRHPQTGEFMYASEAALNGALHPGDTQIIHILQEELEPIPATQRAPRLPIGVGKSC